MQAAAEAPYEVSHQRTHLTITVRPPLTEAEWSVVEKAGDDILSQINGHKPRGLMIDLSPLEFMGSSTVAMIVRCWKAIKPQKQRFVVVSSSSVVCEVLELSGLAQMWTIVKTPEEALKSLGVSTETERGQWAVILGAMAVLVAATGVGLWFARPGSRELATTLIYGGAGLGFVLSLAVMMLARSARRRWIGLGLILLSAGAGVVRLIMR